MHVMLETCKKRQYKENIKPKQHGYLANEASTQWAGARMMVK
jgi:hypothetical protein